MTKIINSIQCAVLFILITFTLTATASSIKINETITINAAKTETEFLKEFLLYTHNSRHISEQFKLLLDKLNNKQQNVIHIDDIPHATNPPICLKCRSAVFAIKDYFERKEVDKEFKSFLLDLCDLLTSVPQSVCEGYVNVYSDVIEFIAKKKSPELWSSDEVCGILYQGDNCSEIELDVEFDINPGEPMLKKSKPKSSAKNNQNNLTILQLTDFHYDTEYAEGSSSYCQDDVCCRQTSLALEDGSEASISNKRGAGKWGDEFGSCDSPKILIDNICDQAASHSNIDYIYYTGDMADHMQSNTTQNSVKFELQYVTDLLKNSFGCATIIPVLGNHDIHPSNLFAPSNITDDKLGSRWLFEFMAKLWENRLPESALSTLRTHGYYSFKLNANLRIVVLNNNVCYTYNLWLIYEVDSLREQLQWFYDTLLEAETSNEKVHVLAHVPPNEKSCLHAWNRKYLEIIRRFSHIISAQFNGHSHTDEFSIIYTNSSPSNALNVAWNGGSGTPFSALNPNYRIYYIDGESYEVVDHETWVFNLTKANEAPANQPVWFKEYSFREEYNLTDLSPASLDDMVQNRWFKKDTLMMQYWKNSVKNSDTVLKNGCDEACLHAAFCDIVMCP